MLLCIVNYYSQFPIHEGEGLPVDNLFRATTILFAEYGLPKKIVSDAGRNFKSD